MTGQPHILLVEDDRTIAALLAKALASKSFRVTVAGDGRDMDRVLRASRIDLIVLDVMLPGEDGLSICRRLRASSDVPIIMASARGDEIDRVVGLEIGADDYLAKPFGASELTARIRAVLRRIGRAPTAPSARYFEFVGWRLDRAGRTLETPSGSEVALTGAEFELLLAFCERPGIVLNRDQLVDLTRGRASGPFERSVDILVSRLRRKLGDGFIRTVRNQGYVFSAEVDAS